MPRLLQDIGMLVLNQVIGAQYGEISGKANTHAELIKVEQESLSLTHAEVGAILAEQWKLPPILATSVGASHDPSKVADPVLRKSLRSSRSPARPRTCSSILNPRRRSSKSVLPAPPPTR